MTLKEAVALRPGEMVSLIGAGGKTTTLFRLADELYREGGKVLVTTTTKIFKPAKPHVHRLFLAQNLGALLSELIRIKEPMIVGVGFELDDAGKLRGLPVEWFDILKKNGGMDSILIEADGAAMKPFKVPGEHEPVVPEESSVTVWVMGMKILSEPLTSASCHRAERAARLLNVEIGAPVTEEIILRLVKNPEGCLKGIPTRSRKIALINQADTPEQVKEAAALGSSLMRYGIERVVITSYVGDHPVKEVLTAGR